MGLLEDPFAEFLDLGIVAGVGSGDEAAALGCVSLIRESGNEGAGSEFVGDECVAADGGAETTDSGVDDHAVEAEAGRL